MKNRISSLFTLVVLVSLLACSKDDEKPTGITHVGEQWKIVSGEYNLIDLSIGGGGIKSGSAGGFFYLNGGSGSFDLDLDGTKKEDVFSYTEDNGGITIVSVAQNVGTGNVSQNVIAVSGEMTTTTPMTLSGTVVKQATAGSATGTSTMTLTNLVLQKQ